MLPVLWAPALSAQSPHPKTEEEKLGGLWLWVSETDSGSLTKGDLGVAVAHRMRGAAIVRGAQNPQAPELLQGSPRPEQSQGRIGVGGD